MSPFATYNLTVLAVLALVGACRLVLDARRRRKFWRQFETKRRG